MYLLSLKNSSENRLRAILFLFVPCLFLIFVPYLWVHLVACLFVPLIHRQTNVQPTLVKSMITVYYDVPNLKAIIISKLVTCDDQ